MNRICDGYWIRRANYFMGYRVRFSGWGSDRVLRLFRRDLGVYDGGTDHAEVKIATGRVGALRRRMLHYSYWSYDDYMQRLQRYTSYQAEKWYREGRRASVVEAALQHAAAVSARLHLRGWVSRWIGRVSGLRTDGLLFVHETGPPVAAAARATRGQVVGWTGTVPFPPGETAAPECRV